MNKVRMLSVAMALFFGASICLADELTLNGKPLRQNFTSSLRVYQGSDIEATSVKKNLDKPVADYHFWAFYAGTHIAMLWDGRTTFTSRRRCPDCIEGNPLARPFIDLGPATSYIAGTAIESAAMYVAYRVKGSKNKTVQKMWFVIPLGIIAAHSLCALNNMSIK